MSHLSHSRKKRDSWSGFQTPWGSLNHFNKSAYLSRKKGSGKQKSVIFFLCVCVSAKTNSHERFFCSHGMAFRCCYLSLKAFILLLMISRPKNYWSGTYVRPLENLKEWLIKIEDIDCLALQFSATPQKISPCLETLNFFRFFSRLISQTNWAVFHKNSSGAFVMYLP